MYLNLFLTLIGFFAAVHLICTATFLPPKSPWTIIIEIAGAFSSAVGVTITSIHADQPRALMFAGSLTLFLVLFNIEKTLRGKTFIVQMYTNNNFFHRRTTDNKS